MKKIRVTLVVLTFGLASATAMATDVRISARSTLAPVGTLQSILLGWLR